MDEFKKEAGTAAFLLLLLISLQLILPSAGLSNNGTGDDLARLPGSEPFRPEFAGSIDQSKASPVPSGQVAQFPEAPVEVDDMNIDEMVGRYSPLVIDCWKIGCKPCKSIEPVIDDLAEDYKGRIAFGKLCINRNAATAKKYSLSRAPTLLIFNNGTLVYKHVGNYPRDRLEEIILTALRMR